MMFPSNEAPPAASCTFTNAQGFPFRSFLGWVLAERSIGATSNDFTVSSWACMPSMVDSNRRRKMILFIVFSYLSVQKYE